MEKGRFNLYRPVRSAAFDLLTQNTHLTIDGILPHSIIATDLSIERRPNDDLLAQAVLSKPNVAALAH